ncbi:hypothetical protein [Bosea sp. 124]|uniref:hypothetical protein n=1 Tax=Bosea sp. 124 TaxID=2135642 RepID=UPI000D3626EC|nr:hypothetical protein [Bosea sp. 124]
MEAFIFEPRAAWASIMLLLAGALSFFGFLGWRHEARAVAELVEPPETKHQAAARIKMEARHPPRGFAGIAERLKKRAS